MIQFVSPYHIKNGHEFTTDFVMTNAFAVNVFIPWLADMGYEGLLGLRSIYAMDANFEPIINNGTVIKFNEECQKSDELEVLVRLFLSSQ